MPTAKITDIAAAIKTAIDTAAAVDGTFALPIVTEVADSKAGKPPTPSDPMQIQIAYKGVAELARSSTRVLEQALVDLNLSYRHPDSNQQNLATCHLVAQQIRDLFIGFHADGARVEQLLTPNPFDESRAVQGTFNSRLTLDLDVLRTIATVNAPEVTDTGDATPLFTSTRGAVWDAIDNWPAFADESTWARKYKAATDLEELSLHDPAAFELPAIAVTWGPTEAKWWTHIQQQWGQQLFVTFWLPASWQDVAEWRLIQLVQAIYQAAPESSPNVSYVRRAVGRPPSKNSPLSLELVALGRSQQLHAWRGQIALTLTTTFDPNE